MGVGQREQTPQVVSWTRRERAGVSGGHGEVLVIPWQGRILDRVRTLRVEATEQTFTQLLEQVGRLSRRRKAVKPSRSEL